MTLPWSDFVRFKTENRKGIHTLSNCITTLINNVKFTHQEIKETLKIMLLQQEVCYHGEETGRDSKIKKNSHTQPYFPTVNFSNPDLSSTRQLQKGDALISHNYKSPIHPLSHI